MLGNKKFVRSLGSQSLTIVINKLQKYLFLFLIYSRNNKIQNGILAIRPVIPELISLKRKFHLNLEYKIKFSFDLKLKNYKLKIELNYI